MKTFRSLSVLASLGVLFLHAALLYWLLLTPSWVSLPGKRAEPVAMTIIASPAPAPAVPVPPPPPRPKLPSARPLPAQPEPAQIAVEPPAAPEPAPVALPEVQVPVAIQAPPPVSESPKVAEPTTSALPSQEHDGITLSLGPLSKVSASRQFEYVGYLNGGAVAKASYSLERSAEAYQASLRVQATGVTAWFWRGARVDSSSGQVSNEGFVPQRMRQQQADKPAREQIVPPATLDLVSIVFQLSELGRHYPAQLVPGFSARVRVQKINRVDILRVSVLPSEPIVLSGKSYQSVPIELSDMAATGSTSNRQIIWFVPERDWAPMRLSVPTGNYQVEFRSPEMPAITSARETP